MSNKDLSIVNFRLVNNHPYLRALADLQVAGLMIRGIKLEQNHKGQFCLGYPGRKVQGSWQIVCQVENERTKLRLLTELSGRYHMHQVAA